MINLMNSHSAVSMVAVSRTPRLVMFLVVVVLSSVLACMRDKPGNPLDAQPVLEVEVPSLPESGELTTDSLVVELASNSEHALFRYRIDSTEWSEFSQERLLTLQSLDDGEHLLEVESKYDRRDKIEHFSRTFVVSALPATAFFTTPQRILLENDKDTVIIGIGIKNLPACDRMHFTFTGVAVDSIYLTNGDDASSLVLLGKDSIADLLLKPGEASFDEMVQLLKVRAVVKKGVDSTYFSFTCSARDSTNTVLKVDTIRGSVIVRK